MTHRIPARPILIALALVALLAFPASPIAAAAGDGFDPAGTFFEPVPEVLRARMAGEPPDGSTEVWIPYTRLDIAVRDGLEMTRVLQTYRNETAENRGYNFTAAILPDAVFSGFAVWDMGTRHVATLEDRAEAEAAYKETTGDEAPEIARDPGLVRRSADTLSLRIFPIQPGEYKQSELVSHRRLGLAGDSFEVLLPLDRLCVTTDERGARFESRSTEVSVYLTDRLPIAGIEAPPGFTVEPLGDNRFLVRGARATGAHERLAVRYRLAIPPAGHIAAFAFTDGDRNYLLARIAGRYAPLPPPAAPAGGLYLGVWITLPDAPGTTEIESLVTAERLSLPLSGAAILPLLPRDAPLEYSFHAFRAEKLFRDSMAGPTGAYSAAPFRRTEFSRSGARGIERHFETAWARGPLAHLERSLKRGGVTSVHLALEPPPATEAKRLARLARKHPAVRFVLAFPGKIPPVFAGIANLHSFSFASGWAGAPPVSPPRAIPDLYSDMDFEAMIPFTPDLIRRILELAGGLPELDAAAPRLDATGAAGIADARLFLPAADAWRNAPTGECGLLWLSATYPAAGTLELSLALPDGLYTLLSGREAERLLSVDGAVPLPAAAAADRFVASFVARHEAREIERRIAPPRGRAPFPLPDALRPSPEEREALRKRLVELSKRYSFLSPETAFIALPPDLRAKYGFTRQDYETGRLYDLAGMKTGGLPEPADWLILALALAALAWHRRRRTSGR